MNSREQLDLMSVLEMTETIMCDKYGYDWEDSER
jgi:hypothetical protein